MPILMITTGLAACAGSSMLSSQDGFHSAQTLPRAPTNPLSTPVPRGIYNSRQTLLKRVKKKQKAQHGPTASPTHRGRTSGATATTSPPPFTLLERHFATHAAAIHAPCSHSRHTRRRHSRSLQPQPPRTPPDIRGRRRTPPPWPSAAPRRIWRKRERASENETKGEIYRSGVAPPPPRP
jgi:hypothetical protein